MISKRFLSIQKLQNLENLTEVSSTDCWWYMAICEWSFIIQINILMTDLLFLPWAGWIETTDGYMLSYSRNWRTFPLFHTLHTQHTNRSSNRVNRHMTKPTECHVRPAKTPISLGIHPVWSKSSLSTGRKVRSLATFKEHSEDSGQTSPGAHAILLDLCWIYCEAAHVNRTLSKLRRVSILHGDIASSWPNSVSFGGPTVESYFLIQFSSEQKCEPPFLWES